MRLLLWKCFCATAVDMYGLVNANAVPQNQMVGCVLARCAPAKDYFKELSGHWSWAVQWLQKKARYWASLFSVQVTYASCVLFIFSSFKIFNSAFFSHFHRCLSITGHLRATCPTRHPQLRPSSGPSQHRHEISTLYSVLPLVFPSTLCRLSLCVCVYVCVGYTGLCHSSPEWEGAVWQQ